MFEIASTSITISTCNRCGGCPEKLRFWGSSERKIRPHLCSKPEKTTCIEVLLNFCNSPLKEICITSSRVHITAQVIV